MLLFSLFILGHVEIGNGYCRTDMMLVDTPIAMEYPCEYYPEILELEREIQRQSLPEA